MPTSVIKAGARRHIGRSARFRLGLSLAAVVTGAAAAQAEDCAGLKGQTLGWNEATITEAAVAPTSDKQPEHCRAMVKMNDSTLRFESRLPTSGWNARTSSSPPGREARNSYTPRTWAASSGPAENPSKGAR